MSKSLIKLTATLLFLFVFFGLAFEVRAQTEPCGSGEVCQDLEPTDCIDISGASIRDCMPPGRVEECCVPTSCSGSCIEGMDRDECSSRGGSPTTCPSGGWGCCIGSVTPNAPHTGITWEELADQYIGVSEARIAGTIYDLLFPVGIAIGLFAIIAAGYSFMTSQGQPDKVKEAQEKLTSAIVGVLFIVLSVVILRVIIRTLLDPTFNL